MRRALHLLLAIFLLGVFWHLASMAVQKTFLPPPLAAIEGCVYLFKEKDLLTDMGISLWRLSLSMCLALALALPIGSLMGRLPWLDRILSPFVAILYPLPKVVFLPIFIVFLGLGNAPKILVITLIIFFQMLVVIRDGMAHVEKAYITSFYTLGGKKLALWWHVLLPATALDVVTALRISIGSAIAVLFFAETFAASGGLGDVILTAMEARNYPEMYGGILAMAILGLGAYGFLWLLEKRLLRWK